LQEPLLAAIEILNHAAVDAASVLVDQLQDNRNKLAAANSVLDRVGVSVKTKHEVSGKDGGPLVIKLVWDDESTGDDSSPETA
jgi:hypothetical protein